MLIENKINEKLIETLIDEWNLGQKFEDDGYGDLGKIIQWNAIDRAKKLDKTTRLVIADILFPIK